MPYLRHQSAREKRAAIPKFRRDPKFGRRGFRVAQSSKHRSQEECADTTRLEEPAYNVKGRSRYQQWLREQFGSWNPSAASSYEQWLLSLDSSKSR